MGKIEEDKRHTVLLITGCISPDSKTPQLVLTNSLMRRQQYIDSIKYYIEHANVDNIVYCDNSGANDEQELSELAKKRGKRFEWISFYGDTKKTVQFGKGFGECEIVNYALRYSNLIKHCEYLVKVTGRLVIKNLNILLKLSKRGICFCPNKTEDNRLYINTRIYMMPIETYYSYFQKAVDYVDDTNNVYLEHAFGICVENNRVPFKKFAFAPWVEGISGSTGREYKPSVMSYLKDDIKLRIYRIDSKGTNVDGK